MCYYLYGALNGNVTEADYASIAKKYDYKISIGTKHDVKNAVKAAAEEVLDDFRITDWICDCDSPVGKHDPNDPMIRQLGNLMRDLSGISGAKQIILCKTWTGKQNKKEIQVHLKEIDPAAFLADVQENCLYNIEL